MILVDIWECQSEKGTRLAFACRLRTAPQSVTYVPEGGETSAKIKGENLIQHPHLPKFPASGGVPFEATKRNQKSPLGAGPAICIAQIPSQDAQDPLP